MVVLHHLQHVEAFLTMKNFTKSDLFKKKSINKLPSCNPLGDSPNPPFRMWLCHTLASVLAPRLGQVCLLVKIWLGTLLHSYQG